MKKLITMIAAVSVCAALLVGCGNTVSSAPASSDAASSSEVVSSSSEAVSSSEAASADSTAPADTAKLDAIVSAVTAVNPIDNPREIDDTALQYDMSLTPDNIVAYKGSVTNNQDDCALVFAAQAKSGSADAVKTELEAYRTSLASNDLYAEFADKVAMSKDARVVVSGDYVVMVIAGVNGGDYSAIDTALDTALAE